MPIDDTGLHGQRVVVLGGTSGIGLTTAAMAAVAGAHVTVVSNRKASVERALAELPVGASGHAVDLTAPASVYTFFGDLGDIDHLVYTAGESLLVSRPLGPLALDERQQARGVLSDRRVGAADRPSGRGL
jgi:NAD(P)-dependent dehydrogenase (short-subunit alcohol dehydrogenase family)